MVLLNHQVETEKDIVDQKSRRKQKQASAKDIEKAQSKGERVHSLVLTLQGVTQRCFQFIRWLRYCLENATPWQEVSLLRSLMRNFCTKLFIPLYCE